MFYYISDTPTITPDTCYLNHAYPCSLSFGSEDMALGLGTRELAEFWRKKCKKAGKKAYIVEAP